MDRQKLIPIEQAAKHCEAGIELVEFLLQVELIPFVEHEGQRWIEPDWLGEIRRARRLYEDLEVNFAGIEIILRMRQQLLALYQQLRDQQRYHQQQVEQLRQQYEDRLRTVLNSIILELPVEDRYLT